MTEVQMWAVGAAVVALLIAIVVSLLVAGRVHRVATADAERRVREIEARLREERDERTESLRALEERLQASVDTVRERLEAVRREGDEGRAQVLGRLDEQTQQLSGMLNAQGQQIARVHQELRNTVARAERLEGQVRVGRTQAALAQAAALTTKARTHLSEQNTGLAERDLTEADAALQRALALAPEGFAPRIEEVRRGLGELKQSVEARTFPVAAVEIVADRIEGLIAAEEEQ